MRYIKIIYIFTWLLLYVACSKEPCRYNRFARIPDFDENGAAQYYPMLVPNKWVYRVDSVAYDSSLHYLGRKIVQVVERRTESCRYPDPYFYYITHTFPNDSVKWKMEEYLMNGKDSELVDDNGKIYFKLFPKNDTFSVQYIDAYSKQYRDPVKIKTTVGDFDAIKVTKQTTKDNITITYNYYVKGIGIVQQKIKKDQLNAPWIRRTYLLTLIGYEIFR